MSHTSFSLSFSYSKSSCAQHCVSRSKFHAALAGLVDGSFFTSGISAVRQYLENRRYAVSPLAQMRRMSAVFKITSMSFAVTLRIELSDDPAMSQEAMTSHSAIWCSTKTPFSLDRLRQRILKDRCQHFPETVLRMTVIKLLFSRLYRRKGSQNQNPGCIVINRSKRMCHMRIFHSLTPKRHQCRPH